MEYFIGKKQEPTKSHSLHEWGFLCILLRILFNHYLNLTAWKEAAMLNMLKQVPDSFYKTIFLLSLCGKLLESLILAGIRRNVKEKMIVSTVLKQTGSGVFLHRYAYYILLAFSCSLITRCPPSVRLYIAPSLQCMKICYSLPCTGTGIWDWSKFMSRYKNLENDLWIPQNVILIT